MSRSASLERNGILRPRRASKPHICPVQRVVSGHHGDNRARGLPSTGFFDQGATRIPPKSKGCAGITLALEGVYVPDRIVQRGGCQPILRLFDAGVLLLSSPVRTVSPSTPMPCGNAMIAAHVETMVDSTLPTSFSQSLGKVFDFPTIIGITASQLPPFPQGLRLLTINLKKKRAHLSHLLLTQNCHYDIKREWKLDDDVSGNLFPEQVATFTGICISRLTNDQRPQR